MSHPNYIDVIGLVPACTWTSLWRAELGTDVVERACSNAVIVLMKLELPSSGDG